MSKHSLKLKPSTHPPLPPLLFSSYYSSQPKVPSDTRLVLLATVPRTSSAQRTGRCFGEKRKEQDTGPVWGLQRGMGSSLGRELDPMGERFPLNGLTTVVVAVYMKMRL